MRIQHNIMAMSAYRNYNTNTSALSKNLEKLSSGYKINRAGDDAAGLAISEKMRAQITGLDAAQKNVKDGISLVKTAEGAMQEIHDMLNRMDYLATQSANGTYDNETDRLNLQKEVDALKNEINRIAESANFNGIKLLNGEISEGGGGTSVAGIDRIIDDVLGAGEDPVTNTGKKTILDGGGNGEKATKFVVDFTGMKAAQGDGAGGGGAATAAVYGIDGVTAVTAGAALTIGGYTYTTDAAEATLADQLAGFVGAYNGDAANDKWTAAVNDAGDGIKFTAQTPGAIDGDGPATGDIPTGANQITAGADAGGGGAAGVNGQITLKIGATTIGTAETTVTPGTGTEATATEMATAIFGSIADADNVSLNGANWKVTDGGDGKLTFELLDAPTATNVKGDFSWDVTMKDNTGKFVGNHTAGTIVTQQGQVGAANAVANTVFQINKSDIQDGAQITIDGVKVTLAVGPDSKIETKDADGNAVAGVIDLTGMDPKDVNLDQALGKISEGFQNGTTNFIVGVNDKTGNDVSQGLTVHKKDSSTKTYDTKEKLAEVFGIETPGPGKALTLQIGDDSAEYNQMKVDVKDMHTTAMGIAGVDIGTQEGAQNAIDVIKNAINYVSSVRGDLGAVQNRLEHTGNNLSVMAENIQDAESTIRDTDVANEMMSYVKNNILVQSAQAMLAQANQVPQGVLQLLG